MFRIAQKLTRSMLKKLLAEYWEKKKDKKPSLSAVVKSEPVTPTSSRMASSSANKDESAVVQAEIVGFKFACRIDSVADGDVISETIVNLLGDQGVFLPTRLQLAPFWGDVARHKS